MNTKTIPSLLSIAALLTCGFLSRAQAIETLYFSIFEGNSGGLAKAEIDTTTGKITARRTLFKEKESYRVTAVTSPAKDRFLLRNENNDSPWLLGIDIHPEPPKTSHLRLKSRPTYLAGTEGLAVAADAKGSLYAINPNKPEITATVDLNTKMDPPPARIGDLQITPDGKTVFAVLPNDTSGNGKGHRLVAISCPDLRTVKDIDLPRDRKDLHFTLNARDSGPRPSFARASPETNTLLVGLNNYGAIAFYDLDAAIHGEMKNAATLPTSKDGTFGKSFPGDAMLFNFAGRNLALVSNSSPEGGAVLVDLAKRTILHQIETGPRELGAPIFQPGRKRLVGVHTGTAYTRIQTGIEERNVEPKDVVVIDLAPLESGGKPTCTKIDFEEFIYAIATVDPAKENLVLLAARNPKSDELSLVLYDLDLKKELDRRPSGGVVRSFVPAR